MTSVVELQQKFVSPNNELFLSFIPQAGKETALAGDLPDLSRGFSVQSSKKAIDADISKANFSALKDTIRAQNESLLEKINASVAKMMEKANKDVAEEYDVDLALSIAQMVPMPPHQETERLLAFSMHVNMTANDAQGQPKQSVAVVTATLAHVKGKVLFLYANGKEADLDWTREAGAEWANAVLMANPPDLLSEARESRGSAFNLIDMGGDAITGAAIGLSIGVFAWVRKRLAAKRESS
ncbi:MAG: hypothetical protein GC160_30010 [Acidobacteria bacterium]|nr:hypothetical protein [Acidobacteriota bacterium]